MGIRPFLGTTETCRGFVSKLVESSYCLKRSRSLSKDFSQSPGEVRTKATKQKDFYNDKLATVVNVLANDNFKVLLEEGEKKGEKRKYEGRFLTKVDPEPAAEQPEGSELDAKRQKALDLLGDADDI